jgi:hypothetical protein
MASVFPFTLLFNELCRNPINNVHTDSKIPKKERQQQQQAGSRAVMREEKA